MSYPAYQYAQPSPRRLKWHEGWFTATRRYVFDFRKFYILKLIMLLGGESLLVACGIVQAGDDISVVGVVDDVFYVPEAWATYKLVIIGFRLLMHIKDYRW